MEDIQPNRPIKIPGIVYEAQILGLWTDGQTDTWADGRTDGLKVDYMEDSIR